MVVRALTSEEKERVQKVMYEDLNTVTDLKTSEELHYFAWNYNWDDSVTDALLWVIRHPLCDKGTASLLYWHAGPGYLYQYADRKEIEYQGLNQFEAVIRQSEVEIYDFVKEVEQKFLSGYYTQQNISFDPHNDDGTDWINEYSDVIHKQPIPDEMLKATPGDVALREDL